MHEPTLELLVAGTPAGPAGGRRFPPAADEAALAALYTHPAPRPGRTFGVRAQMVGTLDGAATGPDARSGSIHDPADQRVFRVTRVVADVVLIGAGTARDEGYTALEVPPALRGTRRAAGRAPGLELAVVSRSGRVPQVLLDADRPPLVLTGAAGAGVLAPVLDADRILVLGEDEDGLDLTAGLAALAGRGLARVLTEGGPHLLRALLAAGLVDELALTQRPVLVSGAGPRVLAGSWLEPPVEARLRHLLHADGTLLGLWRVGDA